MKHLLYAALVMHSWLIFSAHAMERELPRETKKLILSDEVCKTAIFDSRNGIKLKSKSRIEIPVNLVSSESDCNSEEKKYIVCALQTDVPRITNEKVFLTDQQNNSWEIQFKTTQDTASFQESYKAVSLEAKVNQLSLYIQRLFSVKGYEHTFYICKKSFFDNHSLRNNISRREALFFQNAADLFKTRYFADTTHILVVTGYKKSSDSTYQLAIPLQLSVQYKRIDYDDFKNLYIRNVADTNQQIQTDVAKRHLSECEIAVDIEDKDGELYRVKLPFYFSGSESDVQNLSNNSTPTTFVSYEKLEKLIALYEAKKDGAWQSLMSDESKSIHLFLKKTDTKSVSSNESKEEIEDEKRINSVDTKKILPASSWNIGKILSSGALYATSSANTVVWGLVFWSVGKDIRSKAIMNRTGGFILGTALAALLLPDGQRYYEKYFNSDRPITVKEEAKHVGARIVSTYLCYKLIDWWMTKAKK